VPARRGDFDALSPKTQARWRANYGGRGTPEQRQRSAKVAYEGGLQISRERAGHEPATVRAGRTMSAFVGPDVVYVEFSGLSRAEATRLGRYNSLVRRLQDGQISRGEFLRIASGWRPVAGQRLSANPEAVLARLEVLRAEDVEVFRYRSGRAT
jgi:hypothetical protein